MTSPAAAPQIPSPMSEGAPAVIPTLVPPIDKMLGGGLTRSGVVLMLGKAAGGKTAVTVGIADHMAKNNHNVMFVDLGLGSHGILNFIGQTSPRFQVVQPQSSDPWKDIQEAVQEGKPHILIIDGTEIFQPKDLTVYVQHLQTTGHNLGMMTILTRGVAGPRPGTVPRLNGPMVLTHIANQILTVRRVEREDQGPNEPNQRAIGFHVGIQKNRFGPVNTDTTLVHLVRGRGIDPATFLTTEEGSISRSERRRREGGLGL